MISRDELYEILETLKKHKSRTLLTSFGVFWGIFMLIFLLGSGDGLEKGVTNMFKGYDLNSFHIYSSTTELPYEGFKENRLIHLTNDDLDLVKNKFKTKIKYIGARSYTDAKLVKKDALTQQSKITGFESSIFKVRNFKLIDGRFFDQTDDLNSPSFAIIGSAIKQKLYNGKNPVGEFIQIENDFYRIIGVFESFREGEQANDENKTIIIPHGTFQKRFNYNNQIDNIGISSEYKNVEADILSFLKKRHDIHPNDEEAIYVWNTMKEFSKYQGLFKAIRIFMWVIGIGTLLSGIIGVSNIMIINIKERTKEIGIRKAIGATPFSIIKMIVLESVFLTAISGYFGLSIGLLLIEGINYALNAFRLKSEFFLNPEINLFVVLIAIITLILAGFFAAFLPARKAALIKPIEALREN